MDEELQPGESFVRHLIAGATAGTVEHCALFPIDTIKVKPRLFQMYNPNL
jgi:hypothetical protein